MAFDDNPPLPSAPPAGLRWRASTAFILSTIAAGMFTDLFLYGLVVPVLPFVLRDRLNVPPELIQSQSSNLLAAYSGAQIIVSIPAGILADKWGSRRGPFLTGLAALFAATAMLAYGDTFNVIVAARLLQGTSAAVVWTVGLAMIIDTVGGERLGEIIGSIFSFITVGELVSPPLGGLLYDQAGYVGVFGMATALLGVDFVMRLLVLEKKTAHEYEDGQRVDVGSSGDGHEGLDNPAPSAEPCGDETQPLIQADSKPSEWETYRITARPTGILALFPVLCCFRNPRLFTGMFLSFVSAALLSMFDATIPTEAQDVFGFNSSKAGLLFVPLSMVNLVLGPLAGRAVDRHGTKLLAVAGFGYLTPALALLRLPGMEIFKEQGQNVALLCVLLAICGAGFAMISSPSLVETSMVMKKYEEANPGFFGENGPWGQLYGFNSVFFCAGLTFGPLLGGALRDCIGFGNMCAVFAGLSGLTAILSWLYIGGPPSSLWRRQGHEDEEVR